MKGPGMRVDLDVRRIWRCPTCGAERRTSGGCAALYCVECSDRCLMTLVEPQRPARPMPTRLDLTIELHPDDIDSPPQIPGGSSASPTQSDVAPPPPADLSPPPDAERSKRPGKRPNRRRKRRPEAEADSAAASAPEGDNAQGQSSSPPQASPPSSSQPEGFGEGVLDPS